MVDIAASGIGACAHALLSAERQSGTVVSTFRDGFNVLFADHQVEALISFHGPAVPRQPWGVALAVEASIPCGASCRVEDLHVVFSSGVGVDLRAVRVLCHRVTTWTPSEAWTARGRMSLIGTKLGADRHEDSLWSGVRCEQEGLGSVGMLELVGQLCGLGSGSTPSGDDYLVGRLAALYAASAADARAEENLRSVQAAVPKMGIPQRTPLASSQMLLAAVSGRFAEPVIAMLNALVDPHRGCMEMAADRLMAQGSTSGTAALAGIYDGVRETLLVERERASDSREGPCRDNARHPPLRDPWNAWSASLGEVSMGAQRGDREETRRRGSPESGEPAR